MDVKENVVKGVLVVKPAGPRLDASVAPAFKVQLFDRINEGQTLICLDLSNVDFMDSSGLYSIMSSLKALGETGDLVLCGLNQKVEAIFRITRTNKVFNIFPSQAEALSSLTESGNV